MNGRGMTCVGIMTRSVIIFFFFFFQAEDGIRDLTVTGVQTCALPISDVEAIGRLISLALRSGIPMTEIYRQLRGISSDRAVGLGPSKVLSVPDAIGIAIEKWMQDKQGVQQDLLGAAALPDRKSTRLNSSHSQISYA